MPYLAGKEITQNGLGLSRMSLPIRRIVHWLTIFDRLHPARLQSIG